MRQKLITLDPVSWDLALKKSNFSAWVRDQLRKERNRRAKPRETCIKKDCFETRMRNSIYCAYHDDGPVGQWLKVGEEE